MLRIMLTNGSAKTTKKSHSHTLSQCNCPPVQFHKNTEDQTIMKVY